jgi:hypothetical protein
MLVVHSMALALLRAEPARLGAGIQERADQRLVRRELTQENLSRGLADAGAVQVQADAVSERRDVFFAETGVGARCAGGAAVEAGFDTVCKLSRECSEWVTCEDSLDRVHRYLPV